MRKKDFLENQYGSVQTALFNVTFKNGKFINIENGENITFKEGSLLKIKTALSSIDDEIYNEITKNETREVLPVNSSLTFYIDVPGDRLYFSGILMSPLIMSKKNNKDSLITKCDFKLLQVQSKLNTEKIDINFNSLNQAFFQMSLRYRPYNKSHVCNVYQTFKSNENQLLEYYRY